MISLGGFGPPAGAGKLRKGKPSLRNHWGLALLALLLVLPSFALLRLGLGRFHTYAEQEQRAALAEKVSMARHALAPILSELREGRATREEALESARERLRTLCFQDEYGPNYIFLNGLDGRVILRPYRTEEEGLPDLSTRDSRGGLLLPGVAARLRAQSGGVFERYPFPNPKTRKMDEKLSYFEAVPELDAMIGTGAYLNAASRAQADLLRDGFILYLAMFLLFGVLMALALGALRIRNLGMGREMRERLRAEEALRRSEATLKAIVGSAPVGIASIKDRHFIEVNEAFARIFQRERADFRGQSARLTYASEEEFETAGRILYGKPGPEGVVEAMARRADGSVVPMLVCVAPLELEGTEDEYVTIIMDISRQKENEAALKASEATIRAVLEAAPIGIATLEDRRILRVNPSFCRMFGRDEAELLGQSTRLLYSAQDDFEALGRRIYAKKHFLETMETVGQRRDGSTFPMLIQTAALDPANPASSAIVLVILDITALKAAETALRASESMLKLVLDNIPQAVFWKDRQGIYLGCNGSFVRAAGADRSSGIVGRDDFEMPWGPERAEAYRAEDADVLASRQPRLHTQEFFRDAEGRERWLDTTKVPLENERGDVIGLLGFFEDITERKGVEDALAQSRLFTEAVMESVPGLLYVYDVDGRLVRWNKRNEEITGLSSEELKGFHFSDWFEGDPEGRRRIEAAFQRALGEGHAELEAQITRRDGSRVPYYFTAMCVEIGGARYVVGVGLDMTEQTKAEEEMLQHQQRFRTIFEASPISITLIDRETGIYCDVNQRFCEVIGRDKEEILGRTPGQLGLFVEEGVYRNAMETLERNGCIDAMEIPMTIPGSGERNILATVRTVPMGGKPFLLFMAVDITEWKHSERAIQESERELRTLFEDSPIGIFRSTQEGRFLQVNPAFAEMLRYEDAPSLVEDMNLRGIPEGLYESPEHRSRLLRRLQENAGTWFVEEVHFRRKDGTYMDGIMSIILHLDLGTGQPILCGFVQDISERKEAEDILKAKTALLSAQANATLDGILVVSKDQRRILTNRPMLDMFQVPPQVREDEDDAPLLAHVISLVRNPDRFLEKVRYLYAHPTETSRDELELKNGMILERYSAPVMGERGEIYGRIWTFHDITERKKGEREILLLKNYLSNVIGSMPSALVGLDQTGRVTQWNRAAEALLGVPEVEALGRPLGELNRDFAPWIEALRREVQREKRPASMEKLLQERGAERHFFELMLYPLVAGGMEGAVVRIQDITERVRIQELMIQTEKMMSVGGLAAGMAHEINNPLGIISQSAQNIERRLFLELPANQSVAQEVGLDLQVLQAYFERRQISQFLGGIREAVTRATRIVSNMLQFSRQSESARHPASLVEILEQALELAANDYDLKKKYDFRNIEILREFDPELPLVPVVAIEIEQVLLNLLRNAAQAMAVNPSGRYPRLVLRIRRDGKHVVLEVEDNGPGMEEAIRRRVFEPFFTTKEPGVGTGLGLSVSYTIITQNHKGLMEVASDPAWGTRFTVRLPMMKESEDA